ncbi:efflux RND transporter periplasmic adaptor subunit [Terasakiella sp. A23]|uniref:efflux RND transporter periplasmic adaptor subunit n=1 Tax=Terasakiella sp. FCG-A23 TaxID=3080561 RepID=UPI002952D615|nr:efflux RND transporter periplasmic adaptor subunit [Terasakiella sp. A23]MDV7340108.1 efflux RND transporter periplasmic adaptor subunit [Terasakiella sp. A23]
MNAQRFFLTFLMASGFAFSAQAADTFMVTTEQVEDRKAVLATVQSVDMTSARARIGGTITELLVDEGTDVEEGQVIARIKDEKLDLEMQAVEARTASLKAERKLAEIALNRAQRLRKSGAGSQAKLDEARTNLDVVVKNLKAMESERDLVLQRMREGAVLSPTNGKVILVQGAKGVVVMPGEPIADIADQTYILRIQIPERHARFIQKGDLVHLGQDTKNGMSIGIIRQVYPEMRQGRVVADVNMDKLDNLFIGERIKVYVATGKRETMLIPCDLIKVRYGLHYVKLADGTDVVVQPGSLQKDVCEILSGLRNGDELLLSAAVE